MSHTCLGWGELPRHHSYPHHAPDAPHRTVHFCRCCWQRPRRSIINMERVEMIWLSQSVQCWVSACGNENDGNWCHTRKQGYSLWPFYKHIQKHCSLWSCALDSGLGCLSSSIQQINFNVEFNIIHTYIHTSYIHTSIHPHIHTYTLSPHERFC